MTKKHININYTPTGGPLELVKLDTGAIMNLGGRSLPF